MQKSKFITLLKTFSKEEIKEFDKFLSSPYFSRGRNLKPLYNLLKKYHPLFNSPHITNEKIFNKLYPGKKYDAKRSPHSLRVLISDMVIMSEKFLMIQRFLSNDAFKESCTLSELRERKLNESFVSAFTKISRSIDADKAGKSYFLRKYLAEQEREFFCVEAKNKDILKYLELQSRTEDSLIIYFISELIRHVQSRKMNYHKEAPRSGLSEEFYRYFDFDKFIETITDRAGNDNEFLKILFYSAKLDSDFNDLESYRKLKSILTLNIDILNSGFYYSAVSRLMNFTMFQKVKEVDYFKGDYIEFYESYIRKAINEKNTVLLRNFAFNLRAIFNAVRIYPRLNMTDRMDNLFKNYSKYMQPEIKKDALNLIEGSIDFSRGNYGSCLRTLSRNEITVPMVVKEIKIMKLKASYELGYYDVLLSEIDSYRHYLLKTKEISDSYKEKDRGFLKLISRLARIGESKKYEELIQLKKEVENIEFPTYHTKWLLEKIKNYL